MATETFSFSREPKNVCYKYNRMCEFASPYGYCEMCNKVVPKQSSSSKTPPKELKIGKYKYRLVENSENLNNH